jgi:hypothetical protein
MKTKLARLASSGTALVVAALMVIGPRGAEACSCLVQTSEQAFAGSTAVFLGTAREIVQSPIPFSFGSLLEVAFDVSRVWKGDVTRTQVVVTPFGGTVCGFGFQTGRAYLVYATRNNYGLWASLCSQTRAADQGAGDLGLGPGSAPFDNPAVAAIDASVDPALDAGAGRGPASAVPTPNQAGMGCRAGGPAPSGGAAGAVLLLLLGWLWRRLRC